jgi:hypothetical protein
MKNLRFLENIKKFQVFLVSSAKVVKALRFLDFIPSKGKIYMVFIDEKGA